MTITTNTCRWRYVGDGASTHFPFDNVIYDATDMKAYVGRIATSAFTLTGLGNPNGGTVIFDDPPDNGADVLLVSGIDLLQGTTYSKGSAFPSAATETALDKTTRLVQQVVAAQNRAIQLNVADADDAGVHLPIKANRRNMLLGFDGDGDVQVVSSLAGATVSAAMIPVVTAGTTDAAVAKLQVIKALSPKQYGAAGDGTTDDHVAIAQMLADAAIIAALGTNCLIDGGGFTFATTRPAVFPSNCTVRDMRLKALPSSFWVGRQIPGTNATNGLYTLQAGSRNVTFENCIADCQGVQGGMSQTDLVANCNGFAVQAGCQQILLRRCFAMNPSSACAALYLLSAIWAEGCEFRCQDTVEAATYTGYGLFVDWFYDSGSAYPGAIGARFVNCNFLNGKYAIYVAAGTDQTYFCAASHFGTAGAGPNGMVAAQILGMGVVFDGCYHTATVRYLTGGTWTDGSGSHTQGDVSLRVLGLGGPATLSVPHVTLQAGVAASTMYGFKWSGLGGSDTGLSHITLTTFGGGSWATPAAYNFILGTVGGLVTTRDGVTLLQSDPTQLPLIVGNTQSDYAKIGAVAGGGTPAYAGPPWVGCYKDDGAVGSADGMVTEYVCSANSDWGSASVRIVDLSTSGTRLGHRMTYPHYDPNDTATLYYNGSSNNTSRYKVFSNGNVVNTNNSYGAICDVRTKRDIVDAPPIGDRLAALRVVEFTSLFHPDGPRRIDFLAQELRAVFPDMVGEDLSEPEEEQMEGGPTLFVNHSRLIPLLVQGFQEERRARQALEARLAKLEPAA